MCRKYTLAKFANFLIIVSRAKIVGSKMVTISARNTIIEKFTNFSQGYIFRIFQHFATKFWNLTTFERFFPGISFN